MTPGLRPCAELRSGLFVSDLPYPWPCSIAPPFRDALARRLAAAPEALAAYLGGSDAFGRADELSDLDLVVVCEAGGEPGVLQAVEAELAALGGIARVCRIPTPAWHGMEQAFYALQQAPPELLVDLVCGPLEKVRPFLVPERHGQPVVLHDPQGVLIPAPLDRAAHQAKVRAHVEQLRARFELLQPLVTKELARGRPIDAMAYYQGQTLRPLVDMLRCAHCPDRYDYGMRYLEADLPAKLAAEVRRLAYVGSPEELGRAVERARELFREAVAVWEGAQSASSGGRGNATEQEVPGSAAGRMQSCSTRP